MAKTLTYRVVVFALLAAITFYFTGNAGQTTVIAVVFNVAGALVYYIFERLWNAITWGSDQVLRVSRPQEQSGSLSRFAGYLDEIQDSSPQ